MEWEEVDIPGAGPKMLYPMAWSLLPIAFGIILMFKMDGLWPTSLLAIGIMLSLFAVWVGTTIVPGRVDMLKLLVSPFAAFSLFFQPPEIVQVILTILVWTLNYRTAAFLSAISLRAYRTDWDEEQKIPDVEGAVIFRRNWSEKPLLRIGKNIVRGVRARGRTMLEADSPVTFIFNEGSQESL